MRNQHSLSVLFFIFIYQFTLAQVEPTLYHVNGGIFGSTNYANVCATDLSSGTQICFDTIGVNSVQDILIDGDIMYVAAQDSIIAYSLATQTRIAEVAFNAPSTKSLAISDSYLLVGNWYEPWGHIGPYTNHLRVFNKNDLSYIDSIPTISHPATDIFIHENVAYIAQNNTKSSGWGDTLGFVSVLDLNLMQWIRNDTLSQQGADIGRFYYHDSTLYAFNAESQTISSLHLYTGDKETIPSVTSIYPKSYGPTIFEKNNLGQVYIPCSTGIGLYDVINNNLIDSQVVSLTGAYAFTYDSNLERFAVTMIDYLDQSNNRGVVYDNQGDSIDVFPVGFSPELVAYHYPNNTSIQGITESNISMYPNPASDHCWIDLKTDQNTTIQIYHLNGRLVHSMRTSATNISLPVAKLENGIYWVKVKNIHGTHSIPLYIQR